MFILVQTLHHPQKQRIRGKLGIGEFCWAIRGENLYQKKEKDVTVVKEDVATPKILPLTLDLNINRGDADLAHSRLTMQ